MKYIVDLCRTEVFRAKDSAFILFRPAPQAPLTLRADDIALKDGEFPLRPLQSNKFKSLASTLNRTRIL
jgi:hypothetical protein